MKNDMPTRPEYQPIAPDQVRPGDVYKFNPALDGPPLFADVLEVLPAQNLLRIAPWNGGSPAWTYIQPHVGRTSFGRRQTPMEETHEH